MMSKRCNVCGSNDFRADRALAGRLVCNQCGTALGLGNPKRNNFNKYTKKHNKRLFIYILLAFLIFLLLIFI